MFLHLGGSNIIDLNKIIAVLNLDKIEHLGNWMKLAHSKEKIFNKKIEDISEGEPKSAIITDDSIILSPISSVTLKKRTYRVLA